jgi:hypothetical protein
MTALILAGTATALVLTAAILAIRSYLAEQVPQGPPPRLGRRERVELVARLWVPG